MSNGTRLKAIRKRHRKPKEITVLWEDEGMFYFDDKLLEPVTRERLAELQADDNTVLIIVTYVEMNPERVYGGEK